MSPELPEVRLLALEAVALELVARYGACAPEDQDELTAALWVWVASEARAARDALRQLAEPTRTGAGGDT
jgi:hypothetical protein